MATSSPANLRAFVRRHTRLVSVPDLPGVHLQLADDVMDMCRLTGRELGQPDPDLPYWAFAWAGGLAICRYLLDHPGEVEGRTVIDVASGSGLCAIIAMRCGAASAQAFDIDPFAEAAVDLNARANGVHVGFSGKDILSSPPPPCDVILAGDVCYQETMASRMLVWLRQAAETGTHVLVGDPGRSYLPADLERVAAYKVSTSLELEDTEIKESAVFTFAGQDRRGDGRLSGNLTG